MATFFEWLQQNMKNAQAQKANQLVVNKKAVSAAPKPYDGFFNMTKEQQSQLRRSGPPVIQQPMYQNPFSMQDTPILQPQIMRGNPVFKPVEPIKSMVMPQLPTKPTQGSVPNGYQRAFQEKPNVSFNGLAKSSGAALYAAIPNFSSALYSTGASITEQIPWAKENIAPTLRKLQLNANIPQANVERIYESENINPLTQTVISATANAVPDALLALASGGVSIGGQASTKLLPQTGKALTTAQATGKAITELAKNPLFYTSAGRTYGQTFDEAKAKGASDTAATYTALLNSAIGAGIEVGGGLEVIPQKIKNGGTTALKTWVDGMMDEGKEEILQQLTQGALQKIIYDAEKPLYSTIDPEAVVNPIELGKAGLMGATVGGILGGGQIGVQSAINNAVNSQQPVDPAKFVKFVVDNAARFTQASQQQNANTAVRTAAEGDIAPKPNILTQNADQLPPMKAYAQRQAKQNLAKVASRFGAEIEIAPLAQGINGFYQNGKITISESAPLSTVFTHELTHHIEQTGQYGQLADLVTKHIGEQGGDFATLAKELQQDYGLKGVPLDDIGAQREAVAKFIEDKGIFTDESFINRITQENPSLAQKIINWISDTIKKIGGDANVKLLIEARQLYEKAAKNIQTNGATKQGTQFSVKSDTEGNSYVEIDGDILAEVPKAEWNKKVREALVTRDIDVGGEPIGVNSVTRNEFTKSKYTENVRSHNPNLYADKYRMSGNIDEVAQTAQPYKPETLNHPRKDNIVSFERGKVPVKVGNNSYIVDAVVGLTSTGKKVFYDVTNIAQTQIKTAQEPMGKMPSPLNSAVDNNNISQDNTVVNTYDMQNDKKYSLSTDNEGRELSPEQQEFFEDSKVRDEQGRLLEVYHGTPNKKFTVFDMDYTGLNSSGGFGTEYGFFFSDSKEVAAYWKSSDYKAGRIIPAHLNLVNPAIYDMKEDNNSSLSLTELAEMALSNDFDGVIFKDVIEDDSNEYSTSFLAFSPSQIKSVDNLNPTQNPDIRYSLETENEAVQKVEENADKATQRSADTVQPKKDSQTYQERQAAIDEIKSAAKMGAVDETDINALIEAERAVADLEKEIALNEKNDTEQGKRDRERYKNWWKRELAKKEATRNLAARVLKEKNIKNERLQKALDHYNEVRQNERARRSESAERSKLLKKIKKLDKLKLSPEFKTQLESLIGGIDTTSKGMTEKGIINLSELKAQYTEMQQDPNFLPKKDIEKKIARIEQTQIADMNIKDVRDLTDVLSGLEHQIKTAKKEIGTERMIETAQSAENFISEVNTSGGRKSAMTKFGQIVKDTYDFKTLSPKRALGKITGWIGEEGKHAYKMLNDGQLKMLNFQMNATKKFESFIKENRKTMETWSGKKAEFIDTGIVTANGEKVRITPSMRLSLYLHSLNNDNLRHIDGGGLTIPDEKLYKQGSTDAYAKGYRIQLSPSEVQRIVGGMTDAEQQFADLAYDFFNVDSKAAINEVSMLLNGYELANVENYFPIGSNKDFTRSDPESLINDGTLEGMGMLNERVNSANPIVLEDATDVLLRQIDNVSRYQMAPAVRNFNNMLNWTSPMYGTSTKETINKQFGKEATDNINKLLTDIQSPKSSSNALDRLRGKFAQGVLSVNVGVAVKQLASIPTAATTLGWKHIGAVFNLFYKTDRAIIDKYTPYLWHRAAGNSSTELGDIKRGKDMNGKLPLLMGWIQGMDTATTTRLWAAAESYVRENNKDLKRGSKEYYKKVAEIYNQTLEDTQPMYTTMQRPDILRTDNQITKAFTMFQTQRIQNYNTLVEAVGAYSAAHKNGTKAEKDTANKNLANAISANIVATATVAAMSMLSNVAFGKLWKYATGDEEEVTATDLIWGLGKEFVATMAGNFLWGSEIYNVVYSALSGEKRYDVEAAGVSLINDLLNQTVALAQKKDLKSAKELAFTIAQIGGVPAKNIENILVNGLAGNFAPGLKAEYDNLFTAASKATLKYANGKNVEATAEKVITNQIKDAPDSVKNELKRLYMLSKNDKVLPSSAQTKITVNGEERALNNDEKTTLKTVRGNTLNTLLEDVFSSDEYQKLSDEDKQKVVEKIYTIGNETGKVAILSDFKYAGWIQKALDGDPVSVILNQTGVSSSKEQTRTVVSSAKGYAAEKDYQQKTLNKIEKMGLSVDDYAYVDDRIGAYSGAEEKVPQLRDWGFKDKQLNALVKEFVLSDTAKDKLTSASDIGIDSDTYIKGWLFGFDTEGSIGERNEQIAEYVDRLKLSENQKVQFHKWLKVSGKKGTSSGSSSGGSGRSKGGRKSGGKSSGTQGDIDLKNFFKWLAKRPTINPNLKLSYGEDLIAKQTAARDAETYRQNPNMPSGALEALRAVARKRKGL